MSNEAALFQLGMHVRTANELTREDNKVIFYVENQAFGCGPTRTSATTDGLRPRERAADQMGVDANQA